MQFIYYMELWGQALVVTVIAWIDIFQKITILENHFLCQTKNHCPKTQINFFYFRHSFLVSALGIPYQSYIFQKKTQELFEKQPVKLGATKGELKYLLSEFQKNCLSCGT